MTRDNYSMYPRKPNRPDSFGPKAARFIPFRITFHLGRPIRGLSCEESLVRFLQILAKTAIRLRKAGVVTTQKASIRGRVGESLDSMEGVP